MVENGTEERVPSAASSHEVHEIEDDDKSEKAKAQDTIELNSEDESEFYKCVKS